VITKRCQYGLAHDGTWVSYDRLHDRVSVVGILCRLGRAGISSAMVFVGAGFAVTEVFDVLARLGRPEPVKVV
jgi:hypothetical protein